VLQASERGQLADLLAPRSAADAMAAYYALDHPSDRVTLFAHLPLNGKPNSFLVMARTGIDLFRPLVIPFAGHGETLKALLQAALKPGQPVLVDLPAGNRSLDKLQAAAGLNWRGDHFAEVYVEADPAAVMRGHRAAVLSVIAGHLLGERKIALYRVENEDFAAKAEALDLGFRRTGAQNISAQAILRQDDPKPMEA